MKLENFSLKRRKRKMKHFKEMMVKKTFKLILSYLVDLSLQIPSNLLDHDKNTLDLKVNFNYNFRLLIVQ